MGIRSLLRNAFGRSKATREETGAAPSGAGKPEAATIPEAREESAPAPAPEAEVPAARTAPSETPDAAPAPAPTAATLPAQSSPVDRAEPSVRDEKPSSVRDEKPSVEDEDAVREEAAGEAPAPAEPTAPETPKADEEPGTEAATGTSESTPESTPESTADDKAEPRTASAPQPESENQADDKADDKAGASADAASGDEPEANAPTALSDLVSQAFDNPNPEPKAAAEAAAETAEAKDGEKADATVEAKDAAEGAPESAPKAEAEAGKDEAVAAEDEVQDGQDTEVVADAADAPATAATPDAPAALATTAPALLGLYRSAAATLDKHGLATQRATVYLVLDRSGSMRNYYKDGTVQNLAEQALGLSAHFDDAATVPVVFFSTDVDGTADLDLTNYEGRIEELHAGLGHMGRTNYHWAINAVVEHYKESGSTAPAFVIFQTDGAPTSKPAAERALCEAAELPIFWQFIGFGDPEAKGFDFLRKLDDLTVPEKRAVDNAGFFHAGRDPRSLSHDELYQQLMVEFPEWLTEARTAGVLKDN
ncbi:VWA domain-containing protein [Streptomyces sp. NPDC002446]